MQLPSLPDTFWGWSPPWWRTIIEYRRGPSAFPFSTANVPGGAKDVATTHLTQQHAILNHRHAPDGCVKKFVCSRHNVAIGRQRLDFARHVVLYRRSEEHTSELQSRE